MNRNKYLKPFFLLPLMVAIGLLITACNSDSVDDAPYFVLKKVGKIDKATGVIHYDATIGRWYITVTNSDKKEDARYNIWSEISSIYQQENLRVLFSGEIFQWPEGYDVPPITDHQVIFLSEIEIEQSN